MAQLEVYETDDAVILHGTLPGIRNIDAQLSTNHLLLTAIEQDRQFVQTIALPCAVQNELALIVAENEQLRIVVPKEKHDE